MIQRTITVSLNKMFAVTNFMRAKTVTLYKVPVPYISQIGFYLRCHCHYDAIRRRRAEFRMSTVFQEKFYTAIVREIVTASTTIKLLRLFIDEPGFSFKAGQWVDFHVPGIVEVTGYSMTSPPHLAKDNGTLELAVKYGAFPPTQWVHSRCKEGCQVDIRVGGDFFYDPQPDSPSATADLLLIGGGVGINPLVSILYHYCSLLESSQLSHSGFKPGKVYLLYSAKTEEELIFKEVFSQMEKNHPMLNCQYFVTGGSDVSNDPKVKCHRIMEEDIIKCVKRLKECNTLCYICGPSTMTDDIADLLLRLGIKKECIKYEKWW